MALDLIDLRTKVMPETSCALAAEARATGVDKSEIAREILDKWGAQKIHSARMLHTCLRAKGLTAAAEGIVSADQGGAGKESPLEWDT